ncbi:MAG: KTSC domain-containing protein [Oligoflexales bacterium]
MASLPALESVSSSAISAIGYLEGTLYIEFRETGHIYAYGGVSASTYQAFRSAVSIGAYFNQHILDHYPEQRIS